MEESMNNVEMIAVGVSHGRAQLIQKLVCEILKPMTLLLQTWPNIVVW